MVSKNLSTRPDAPRNIPASHIAVATCSVICSILSRDWPSARAAKATTLVGGIAVDAGASLDLGEQLAGGVPADSLSAASRRTRTVRGEANAPFHVGEEG